MEIVMPAPYHNAHENALSTDDEQDEDDEDDDDDDEEEEGHAGVDVEGGMGALWEDFERAMDRVNNNDDGAEGEPDVVLRGMLNDAVGRGADGDDDDEEEEDDEGHDEEVDEEEDDDEDEEGDEIDEAGVDEADHADDLVIFDGEDDDMLHVEDDGAMLPVDFMNGLLERAGGGRGPTLIQQNRMRRIARRQVMEMDIGAADQNFDIHWAGDEMPHFMDPRDFPGAGGRPHMAVRGVVGGNAVGDQLTHPLLVNQGLAPAVNPRAPDGRLRDAVVGGGDGMDWSAFDDLIGGNTLQLFEQIFRGALGREGNRTYTFPLTEGHFRRPDAAAANESNLASSDSSSPPQNSDRLALIHAQVPVDSPERWWQEARMLYGNSLNEKALQALNSLLNVLIPEVMEEEKRKKARDSEKKAATELEKAKRAEEERQLLLQEEAEKLKKKEAEDKEAAAAAAKNLEVESQMATTVTACGPSNQQVTSSTNDPEELASTLAPPTSAGGDDMQQDSPQFATSDAAAAAATEAVASSSEPSFSAPVIATAPATVAAPRVIVNINGSPVDITGKKEWV